MWLIDRKSYQSRHQALVTRFMNLAGQCVANHPRIMTNEEALLRATLVLEEAHELIKRGLGVDVMVHGPETGVNMTGAPVSFHKARPINMLELVDGCCDLRVVTTGTLCAAGIADDPHQHVVDKANLRKFAPGGYRRDDGKWMKPENWVGPDDDHRALLTAAGFTHWGGA